jgi:hypothetical protein
MASIGTAGRGSCIRGKPGARPCRRAPRIDRWRPTTMRAADIGSLASRRPHEKPVGREFAFCKQSVSGKNRRHGCRFGEPSVADAPIVPVATQRTTGVSRASSNPQQRPPFAFDADVDLFARDGTAEIQTFHRKLPAVPRRASSRPRPKKEYPGRAGPSRPGLCRAVWGQGAGGPARHERKSHGRRIRSGLLRFVAGAESADHRFAINGRSEPGSPEPSR